MLRARWAGNMASGISGNSSHMGLRLRWAFPQRSTFGRGMFGNSGCERSGSLRALPSSHLLFGSRSSLSTTHNFLDREHETYCAPQALPASRSDMQQRAVRGGRISNDDVTVSVRDFDTAVLVQLLTPRRLPEFR